jgi:hypothetical protein
MYSDGLASFITRAKPLLTLKLPCTLNFCEDVAVPIPTLPELDINANKLLELS